MEKAKRSSSHIAIIVVSCLAVTAILAFLLFYVFLGCVFDVKHTAVFRDGTYIGQYLPLQFSQDTVVEQFSFTLKETDDRNAAEQDYAGTLKNHVDGRYFSVDLRLKFVGDTQEETYVINQVKSGPEPIRPNRYFFTVDLSSKGLGQTVWKAEFDDESAVLLCYDYDNVSFWFEFHD